VTTFIVTPVELPTVAVHTPDVTVAALTEVEENPTVVETAVAKTHTNELANLRILMGKSYSEESLSVANRHELLTEDS
jgi:hypothetical protein